MHNVVKTKIHNIKNTKSRRETANFNSALFSDFNNRNVFVQVNKERFPAWCENQLRYDSFHTTIYKVLVDYIEEEVGASQFGLSDFKTLYPILLSDICNQSENENPHPLI